MESKKHNSKILIVEDSKTQALKLELLLKNNHYDVHVAENGLRGLEILETTTIDLIISDIIMPEMDGFMFCESLKTIPKLSKIPIIILTNCYKTEDVMQALSLGIDNYISKPYDDQYMIYLIDKTLNNKLQINYVNSGNNLIAEFESASYKLKADPKKILNFFISSYEASTVLTKKLEQTKHELEEMNQVLELKVRHRTIDLENEIKEHKSTLGKLQKALADAQKLDKLKTEFLNNISHEIRTPMNAIVGFSNIISDPTREDNDKFEYLPYITSATADLLQIIEGIIEASEILIEDTDLQKAQYDLEVLFKNLFEIYSTKCDTEKQGKIKVEYTLPEEFNKFEVVTYGDKLKTILDHLLNNAIKFTNEGKINYGVSVLSDNQLMFFVSDSGLGILEEDFTDIFETFKKVGEKHENKYKGTGIGLSIVKKTVELMGGEIWLESEPGKGSVFYFTVPFIEKMKKLNSN